jgi:hypothetical protein
MAFNGSVRAGMKPHLLFLVFAVLGSDPRLTAQGDNIFEARHAHAEAKNPLGLSMVLDTVDGRRTYSESEHIPLVIRYSSNTLYKYKLEVGRGTNAASISQRLYTDVQTPVSYMGGFVCCGWQQKPLSSAPQVVKPYIFFRLKPGKHELYVTARQVFPWSTGEESGKELLTTSSILSLDITPDPGWQQRELAKVVRNYGAHPTSSCSELGALSIPEATPEKLKVIDQFDDCRGLFQPAEYELAERIIEEWIHDPDHAVSPTALDSLMTLRAEMSHPEFAEWSNDPERQEDPERHWLSALKVGKAGLADEICTGLPAKHSAARVSTRKNVCEFLRWQPIVKGTTCGCQADSAKH